MASTSKLERHHRPGSGRNNFNFQILQQLLCGVERNDPTSIDIASSSSELNTPLFQMQHLARAGFPQIALPLDNSNNNGKALSTFNSRRIKFSFISMFSQKPLVLPIWFSSLEFMEYQMALGYNSNAPHVSHVTGCFRAR